MADFKQGTYSAFNFRWEIENQKSFEQALDRLGKTVSDFRPSFIAIGEDWYKGNRQLFTLQSRGLYDDLSENYKPQKKKKVGFIYPILVGETRRLSNSILGKKNLGSVFTLRKQSLFMGTRTPYAKYHQSDAPRRTLPQRKIVFISGGPSDKSKDSGINGRRERWLNIINDQILSEISGEVLI